MMDIWINMRWHSFVSAFVFGGDGAQFNDCKAWTHLPNAFWADFKGLLQILSQPHWTLIQQGRRAAYQFQCAKATLLPGPTTSAHFIIDTLNYRSLHVNKWLSCQLFIVQQYTYISLALHIQVSLPLSMLDRWEKNTSLATINCRHPVLLCHTALFVFRPLCLGARCSQHGWKRHKHKVSTSD